ncbi:hypothetical protein ACFX5K_06235 [Rickettsiales bacterium LUAb2]
MKKELEEYYIYLKQQKLISEKVGVIERTKLEYQYIVVKNNDPKLLHSTIKTTDEFNKTMHLLGFTYIEEENAWRREGMTIEDYEKWKEINISTTTNHKGIKRPWEDVPTINQEASSSNSKNNIDNQVNNTSEVLTDTLSSSNKVQRLFIKLTELGKITEQAIINNGKKQINLYVTYDDALAVNKALNIVNEGIRHCLKLLGFIENTKHKYAYTIPYNINLKDYKKYYLPFVISIGNNNQNGYQRISQLIEIYKATTIINNLDNLIKIFNINSCGVKENDYRKLLKNKKERKYIYKNTIE